MMKKRYVITVIVVLLLIAVSAFMYIKNNSLVINGINVPPEPSSSINNATLAGVDSNNNGVRDDVERVLAQQFGGTTDFPFALAWARESQSMITAPTPSQRSDALAVSSRLVCAAFGSSKLLRNFDMLSLVVNSPSRRQARRAFNDVLVGFGSRELLPCATSTSP